MSQDESQAKKPTVKLKPESHYAIAYMTVHGMEPNQIAKEVEQSESYVKSVLRQDDMKILVQKIRHKIYGENPALRFKEILPKAIKTAEDIMDNSKVKPHIRQEVAFKFMDRALGKPGMEVDLGEGTVKTLLALIQNQKPIDSQPQAAKNDIEDANYTELPSESEKPQAEPKEADKIDDWLDKNL